MAEWNACLSGRKEKAILTDLSENAAQSVVRYLQSCGAVLSLRSNPAAKAGNMGSEEHKEMLFWTKEEYKKFSFEMMDKPVSFYAFEMLYWCGIREGELLALTAADFDFEKETVRINKSYQRLKGRGCDYHTENEEK